jgi:hypothetical protein
VLTASAVCASAQAVPTTLNYQGRLTDNTPAQTPVSATVHLRAPFRHLPRVLVQSVECLRRAFDFVRRDVRWRVGLDAQLATVGKGVVP